MIMQLTDEGQTLSENAISVGVIEKIIFIGFNYT